MGTLYEDNKVCAKETFWLQEYELKDVFYERNGENEECSVWHCHSGILHKQSLSACLIFCMWDCVRKQESVLLYSQITT